MLALLIAATCLVGIVGIPAAIKHDRAHKETKS